MDETQIKFTGNGARVTLPGITALLFTHGNVWEVGQFYQAGRLSRVEIERVIAAAFPDLTWQKAIE